MAITNAQAATINKMNVAAQRALLGTAFQTVQTDVATLQGGFITTGSVAVSAAHTNASVVTIATGLGNIVGYQLFMTKSGSQVTGAYVDNSSGSLLVTSSGSFNLNVNDVYNWIAW